MNRLVADIAAASEVAFLMEKASEFIAVHGFRVEHEALTEVLKRAGASEDVYKRQLWKWSPPWAHSLQQRIPTSPGTAPWPPRRLHT